MCPMGKKQINTDKLITKQTGALYVPSSRLPIAMSIFNNQHGEFTDYATLIGLTQGKDLAVDGYGAKSRIFLRRLIKQIPLGKFLF